MDFQRATSSVEQGQDPPILKAFLSRVQWVLVSPSHPGNVGATARALKVTGFDQLWQVDKNGALAAQRLLDLQAQAMASGANDLLSQARHAESLDEALAPCVLSLAFTARPREFEPPRRSLEEGLQEALGLLSDHPEARVAMVFGAERAGLTNDELMSCSRVCGLSVNPGFGSLNLSQAVQVVAYFLRHLAIQRHGPKVQTAEGSTQGLPPTSFPASPPALAPAVSVQALYSTMEKLALASGYLNPSEPGRFRDRLQRLASRTQLLEDEAQLLHGLSREILNRLR